MNKTKYQKKKKKTFNKKISARFVHRFGVWTDYKYSDNDIKHKMTRNFI